MPPSSDPLADLSPDQQRELLRNLLEEKSVAGKRFPMSEGQQGLWYSYRRDSSQASFNVFLPSRVRSPLDLKALRSAIEFLVDRHPCLRTTFTDQGTHLRQQVHDKLPPEFAVIDARYLNDEQLRQCVIEETQRPFDLEKGPLLRLIVWARSEDDLVVLASTHHIVVDFWSLVLLLNELRQVYPCYVENRSPKLPPSNGNYRSFVSRQQKLLTNAVGQRMRDYWLRTLKGVPTVLNWATDFERPDSFTGRASVQTLRFPAETVGRIIEVAKEAKTTTSAVVLAAVEAFIARSTGQSSFMIGSPFSGRSQRQFEQTVGFFVNMLPLKADLSDDPTFVHLVQRVGHNLLKALEHEDYPLAQIVRDIRPDRDSSRTPLFQVSCTFEKAQLREESGRAGFLLPSDQKYDFGGLEQESYYVPHSACHYDVEFVFEQTEAELRGMICYCRDLFASETMSQMAENFQALFTNLLHDPHQSVASVGWNVKADVERIVHPNPDRTTLVDLLDGIPTAHLEAVATLFDGNIRTHGQFQEQTKNIARQLAQRGIGRGDFVPVVAHAGPQAIAAILGVIRSGAAVIPIDAKQPAIALQDLLQDTHAKLVIVDEAAKRIETDPSDLFVAIDDLSERVPGQDPPRPTADDLAYIIYTSGSTGKPKGVMVRHAAIVNTLKWRMETVKLSNNDRLLMLMSHQFDAGFAVAIGSLIQGAAVVWCDPDSYHDVDRIIHQITRDDISVLASVPSWYRLLVTHSRFGNCDGLTNLWVGGESMPSDLPELIRQKTRARIWNFYGPTETAVEAAAWEIVDHDPRRRVPIGHGIANTALLILDKQQQPVPDTVPGQLAICGRGLAEGYLNDHDLTRKKFVSVPGDSTGELRMYLTGDLCRRRPDGAIEFLGRIDDQVKVRGHRIELEEIDAVLRSHPAVENAAVKLKDEGTLNAQLVAFVTRSRFDLEEAEWLRSLKRHVADRLPPFKRPSAIAVLDELPIGSSGKVIRRLLPDAVQQPIDEHVAPSTPLERYLADGWSEMLQVERVSVHQNFFQLGGNSLQAATMTARLSEELGVHVPTALLFDLADIARLSQRLVQLYEVEMAERFGLESVTAYSRSSSMPGEVSGRDVESQEIHPLLANLKPDGERPPLFMVHPPGGIVVCYRELAEQLSSEQPLFAIRSRGLHGKESLPSTLQEMAADYVEALKTVQPNGPYVIGGWSLGGLVAYEVARLLQSNGEDIDQLILLDTSIPEGATDLVDSADQTNAGLEYGIDLSLSQLNELEADQQLPFLWDHAVKLGVLSDETPAEVVAQVLSDLQSLFHHHVDLANSHQLQPLDVDVLLIRPSDVPIEVSTSQDRGWGRLVKTVQVHFMPGHHHSMVQMPQVKQLAALIERELKMKRRVR
ncbi:MAG: amino acid adenylation domain-containing protein [Planctomycetota bacterium]